MIRGLVNAQGEPLVAITLLLSKKRVKRLAVIDTGFNGYLSIPKSLIAQSKWEWLGFENYELASGLIIREHVY